MHTTIGFDENELKDLVDFIRLARKERRFGSDVWQRYFDRLLLKLS